MAGSIFWADAVAQHRLTSTPLQNWHKHTLAWLDGDEIRLDYMPVVITRFQPEERKY